jgi:hypothetical protein
VEVAAAQDIHDAPTLLALIQIKGFCLNGAGVEDADDVAGAMWRDDLGDSGRRLW